jgi:hypothetical protein
MDGITTPPVTPYAIGLLPERPSQVGHKERDGKEKAISERTTAGDQDVEALRRAAEGNLTLSPTWERACEA